MQCSAWDSGAPVIIAGRTPEEDLLVGLGSSGVGCADPVFPAIQARVGTEFTNQWIREQVCRLSVDPPDDFHCSNSNNSTATTTPTTATTTMEEAKTSLVPAGPIAGINMDGARASPVLLLAGCLVAVMVAVFVRKHSKRTTHQQGPLSDHMQTLRVEYGALDSEPIL